jgi:apolipoprotein N-acyltransferase
VSPSVLQRLKRAASPAAAAGAGALAALAHPPFGFLPGLLGYALLLWLADRIDGARPLRRAFLHGWLAGLTYFLIGCWWVAEAFLVDARQAWMAPFAALLLPSGLALFWGAAVMLYRRARVPGPVRILVFAATFAALEWLRGHVLTGFPWNLPGETWPAGGAMSQAAALVGAYGLTLLTVLAAAAFAHVATDRPRRERAAVAAGAIGLLLAGYAHGAWRLSRPEPAPTGTVVRVVQPNIPQSSKWTASAYRGIVTSYVDLTAQPAARRPDVVIWPEGAIPAPAEEIFGPAEWTGPAIAGALQPGQTLIMGAYRSDGVLDGRVVWRNSLIALHDVGEGLRIEAFYDKHRLVPFGEYLPLERWIEPLGIKELVHVGDGFTPGPRPLPIRIPGAPAVQPLICYETLFPGLAGRGPRPGWIVNISNDAWFGRTSGPRQHLNLASYRAIEEGLPIVRATPTGVSAVIDARGRIVDGSKLDIGERGVIDAQLPAPVAPTLYSRVGDGIFFALAISSLALGVYRRFRNPPAEREERSVHR